jgi:hypothetical protein
MDNTIIQTKARLVFPRRIRWILLEWKCRFNASIAVSDGMKHLFESKAFVRNEDYRRPSSKVSAIARCIHSDCILFGDSKWYDASLDRVCGITWLPGIQSQPRSKTVFFVSDAAGRPKRWLLLYSSCILLFTDKMRRKDFTSVITNCIECRSFVFRHPKNSFYSPLMWLIYILVSFVYILFFRKVASRWRRIRQNGSRGCFHDASRNIVRKDSVDGPTRRVASVWQNNVL